MPSPTPPPAPPPEPAFPCSDTVTTRFRCIGVRMLSTSQFALTASPLGRHWTSRFASANQRHRRQQIQKHAVAGAGCFGKQDRGLNRKVIPVRSHDRSRNRRIEPHGGIQQCRAHGVDLSIVSGWRCRELRGQIRHEVEEPIFSGPKGSPCDLVWLVRAQLSARFIEGLLQRPVPLGLLAESVLRVCRGQADRGGCNCRGQERQPRKERAHLSVLDPAPPLLAVTRTSDLHIAGG